MATDDPFVGERNADGDPIVIVDIDGTLINSGRLNQKVYDFAHSLEGAIFIVTGRPESDRDNTVSELKDLGVSYSRLIMNPGSTSDSVDYKKATAEKLLETYDVVAAIENNPDALRAYRSLGIDAYDPASLPEQKAFVTENTRALPSELSIGDFVAWLVQTEAYAGQVVSVDGASTIVRVWDEEDDCDCCEDCWEEGDLDAVVATAILSPIEPLMVCQCDMVAVDPSVDLQGSTVVPTRSKWLNAAYAIKSRIEDGTPEARSLGKTEVRTKQMELRALGDGMTFEGYAAVFNSPSEPLPFTEIVAPGAFSRSLKSRNRMMLLWNHDTSEPLASTRNGSLRMVEDATGLKVTATLPDTTRGRDVAELVRSGVIDSMSFGFSVKKDSWSTDGQTRTLQDVTLYEVSLVSQPAYEGTAGKTSVREAGIDADALADALARLETGEQLNADQATIINDVVSKLKTPDEVAEVDGDLLALKKKVS